MFLKQARHLQRNIWTCLTPFGILYPPITASDCRLLPLPIITGNILQRKRKPINMCAIASARNLLRHVTVRVGTAVNITLYTRPRGRWKRSTNMGVRDVDSDCLKLEDKEIRRDFFRFPSRYFRNVTGVVPLLCTYLSVSLMQALRYVSLSKHLTSTGVVGVGSTVSSSLYNFSCFSGFLASWYRHELIDTDVCKHTCSIRQSR